MRSVRSVAGFVAEMAALLATLATYWLRVFPLVRRELCDWRTYAEQIGDPTARDLAVGSLVEGHSLAEGAAIFATLAPRPHRRGLVRLLVAWQVAYDYLDTVGEIRGDDGHELYEPLSRALDGSTRPFSDPGLDDGGYLTALLATCRAETRRFSAYEAVAPVATRAAARCGEAQLRTHAVRSRGAAPLERWATEQAAGPAFLWWEIAAGGISSLAVHAVLALSAVPGSTSSDAEQIDAAYFPSICAVSTLLDCVVDATKDAATMNHRTTAYYDDDRHALDRLEWITRRAAAGARSLPRGRRHLVILAGMTALYAVSDPQGNHATHARMARAIGPTAAPIAWTLQIRKRASD